MALPAGTTSWQRDGTGDPSRPLLRTVDALGNPHHLRVAPDGSVTEYLKVKQKPLEVFDLTLAPTQVFGTLWGWQPERFKWGWGPLQQQWALSKDSIGPAMATPFAVSMVTGSRWIVSDSRDRQNLYDAARKGARVRDADALSGPFLLYENSVAMVTGRCCHHAPQSDLRQPRRRARHRAQGKEGLLGGGAQPGRLDEEAGDRTGVAG